MGLYFAGALSWPLNGTFVAESGSAEERGFSSFATKCLEKHNAFRNLHKNTPKMTLDQTLQDGAQVKIEKFYEFYFEHFGKSSNSTLFGVF